MRNKSDLLEDQQIHYIVKDYQRMFNMHHQLVDACKEASEFIEKKNKQIEYLENKLSKSLPNVSLKDLKMYLRQINDQFLSCKIHAEKGQKLIADFLKIVNSPLEEEVEENKPNLFKRLKNYLYGKLGNNKLCDRGTRGNSSEDK